MNENLTSAPPVPHNAITPAQRRLGLVLMGLVGAFLTFDVVIHILNTEQVQEAMTDLGWPEHLSPVIGVIEAAALVLYLVRRTSILGAILLTGYLGGAVATHLRAESAVLSTTLFPVYVGIALWAGLCLRDPLTRSVLTTLLAPNRRLRDTGAHQQPISAHP